MPNKSNHRLRQFIFAVIGALVLYLAFIALNREADASVIKSSASSITLPTSSTDNAIVRFDGTPGNAVQNSDIAIDDNAVLINATRLFPLAYGATPEVFTHCDEFSHQNPTVFWADRSGTGSIGLNDTNTTNAHPGNLLVATGTDTTGLGMITGPTVKPRGGLMYDATILFIQNLSDATDEYDLEFGIGDQTDGSTIANGIWFWYDRNGSVNWHMASAENGTVTKTASTTAVAAGAWVKAEWILNAAATTITFYINGTSIGTVTTNIPISTRSTLPFFRIVKSAGTTSRKASLDLKCLRVLLNR